MLVCNHLYYLELLWTKGLFIPQTETYPLIPQHYYKLNFLST